MTYIYTRTDLIADINRKVHNKQGLFIDINRTCNEAVRKVAGDVDLRTTKRKVALTPSLFNQEYEYACPTDLKAFSIIDIPQQTSRVDDEFALVPASQFAVNRKPSDIAIDDYNGVRTILVNSKISDQTIVISDLDSTVSGGGTWSAVGDAQNLATDSDDYFKGNGSLKYDIGSGATTTAGIKNTTLNTFDFTNYVNGNGAIFVWAKIDSITDLTSFTVKVGNDISNYYSKTITAKNDGTAFTTGWNLLRFDMSSLATVGSPTLTTFKYVELYMNKATTKINVTGYKFDYLVLKVGKNADIKYYSKYGWQSSTGTYKENSTAGSDFLVADTDEYDVIVSKATSIAKRELNYPQADIDDADREYVDSVKMYMTKNPSEAKLMSNSYYEY